jgi:tetratricopeptide (TPR) repeat protein
VELEGGLSPAALFELGAAHASRGNLLAATRMLDRLLRTAGASRALLEAAHYELGACRERLGHAATALAHFHRVRAANPGFRDVLLRVARLEAGIPCALPLPPVRKAG